MQVIAPITIGPAQLLETNVPENDYPEWSASTAYATEQRVLRAATHMIYESVRATAVSVVQISIAAPAVVLYPSHGLLSGTPVTFTTTGALPTGLTVGTTYYVLGAVAGGFNLSATPGGAAITTSGTQSGAHTLTAQSNYGRDPSVAANRLGNTPFWREVSATNRYRMFDTSSSSQTEMAEEIVVRIRPGRASTLALVNISADSAHVAVYSGGALRYDRELSLVVENVRSLWEYFFSPIIRKTDEVLIDLTPYNNAEIVVTLRQPNGIAKVGALIVGMPREIGDMQWAPEVRSKNYSRKIIDDFGNTTLIPGKSVKLLTCTLALDNNLVDETQRLLSSYNGLALLWIGEPRFTSTIIYGFFVDFKVIIQDPAGSRCNLEIEGLT